MTAAIYLAPVIAGAIALTARHRTVRYGAALVAAVAGFVLFAVSDSVGAWRTTGPGVAAGLAGAGIVLAFLVLLADPEARGETAAQTGVAGSSLALFAAGMWLVPALLFWLTSSLALAAIVASSKRRATTWLALALGDAALVGVVVSAAIEAGSWTMPALGGWQIVVLFGAIVLRSGALPLSGQWPIERPSSAVAVPLLIAGSLVLAARFLRDPQPVLGAALIVLGVLAGATAAVWRFDMRATGGFLVAVMLGISIAVPQVLPVAALAVLCAATTVALWPRARGRARITRGFVLGSIPPMVAFGAISAAATTSFERARAGEGIDGIAWAAIASLLPLALATGIALGAMAARREPSDDFEPPAVIATWFVFALSVVSGVWLGAFVPVGDAAIDGSTRALYLIALIVGGIAALRAPRATGPVAYGGIEVLQLATERHRVLEGTAVALAAIAAVAAIAAAIYLTVLGLQQGFLA
ncbi:MAG: hypothetical protein M3277_06275 [Actinomycetota bacterium]|nr:hypothetical protein [Actinomycetota bacterium]